MTNATHVWTDLAAPVLRYMRRRVRDQHLAADLAQDVMLKAQASLEDAPAGDKLAAWVFRIARNTLIDFYRSPRSRGHLPIDGLDEHESTSAEISVATELSACLNPMIERLPEPYRHAVRLADIDGLSQQELAERLSISLSGAKSRVQRGREKLKAMLLDCCTIEVGRGGVLMDCDRTPRSDHYCGPAGELR